jgi:hypothetical protein
MSNMSKMSRKLLAGLAAGVLMLTLAGMAQALPVEYDLNFTDEHGVTVDLGFILDFDADGVTKDQDGNIVRTYTDDSDYNYFYARLSRVGSTVIDAENWYTSPDPHPYFHRDFFIGSYSSDLNLMRIETPQNHWDAGYDLWFHGVTGLGENWWEAVSSVDAHDWSNGTLHYSTLKNGFSLAVADASPASPVPEPATVLLFGVGLLGLAGFRLKRKRK